MDESWNKLRWKRGREISIGKYFYDDWFQFYQISFDDSDISLGSNTIGIEKSFKVKWNSLHLQEIIVQLWEIYELRRLLRYVRRERDTVSDNRGYRFSET